MILYNSNIPNESNKLTTIKDLNKKYKLNKYLCELIFKKNTILVKMYNLINLFEFIIIIIGKFINI